MPTEVCTSPQPTTAAPNPGGSLTASCLVGLLTYRLFVSLAFSLALFEQWPEQMEKRTQPSVASGIQRPDRPGFTPEFPVSTRGSRHAWHQHAMPEITARRDRNQAWSR